MNRLIVLGASARAAAASAARAGYAPYAIDQFADRDLAALGPAVRIERYPRGFLRVLAAAPDAPWIYTGGLENHPRLIDRLAGVRPLWGNAGATLRAVRSPARLADALRGCGFCYPTLANAGSPFAAGKWLVKQRRSSAGLGVRFASQADLSRPARGCYVQEYIDGESGSATFVAAGGRAVLLGTTRQIVGRDWQLQLEFLYVGSLAPLATSQDEQEAIARLGTVLAEQFGLAGLFGIDFIRRAGQLWLVEVNPRYSASVEVLERATGENFIGLHAAACVAGELPAEPPAPIGPAAGKAVVYARQDVRVSVDLATLHSSGDVADIPAVGQAIPAGEPIATVFAQGASLADVERQLRQCERQLHSAVAGIST